MKLKVMIIDDDDISVLLHQAVAKAGNIAEDPLCFRNGKDALDFLLNKGKDGSYLIFLDINMPIMDGWELLDKIHEVKLNDNIYVVLVTSSIAREDKIKAKTYNNVIEYIEKPLSKDHCLKLKNIPELGFK